MEENNVITIYKNKAIVNFEGRDFLGQIGIDSRIFNALQGAGVSVGVISQQAIENGISVLVDEHQAETAVESLRKEFEKELKSGIVSQIYSIDNLAVIGLVTDNFQKILSELQKNKIFPLLLNQVASAGRVNLVVSDNQVDKVKNIVETEIFGKVKTVHLVLVGHGNVGSTLIEQILDSSYDIQNRKRIHLKIIAIANSKNIVFNKGGFGSDWRQKVLFGSAENTLQDLFQFVKENQFKTWF